MLNKKVLEAQTFEEILEHLRGLGVGEDVIQFVVDQGAFERNSLVKLLLKNPGVDLRNALSFWERSRRDRDKSFSQHNRKFFDFDRALEEFFNWDRFPNWFFGWVSEKLRPKVLRNGFEFQDFVEPIGLIGDWFNALDAERGEDFGDFDQFAISFDEALRSARHWHENFQVREGSGDSSGLTVFAPAEWGGWQIKMLVSESDYAAEGDQMGHCISGYFDNFLNCSTFNFSLRDAKDTPHVTFELNASGKMVQSQGLSNSIPSAEHLEKIREFLNLPDFEERFLEFLRQIFEQTKNINFAIMLGDFDAVRQQIDERNLDLISGEGFVSLATKHNHPEITKFLIEKGYPIGYDTLFLMCDNGMDDLIRFCIDRFATDITVTASHLDRYFHSSSNNPEIISLLYNHMVHNLENDFKVLDSFIKNLSNFDFSLIKKFFSPEIGEKLSQEIAHITSFDYPNNSTSLLTSAIFSRKLPLIQFFFEKSGIENNPNNSNFLNHIFLVLTDFGEESKKILEIVHKFCSTNDQTLRSAIRVGSIDLLKIVLDWDLEVSSRDVLDFLI